jgi:glycosyltransferase involved in cell wall biosynthesis
MKRKNPTISVIIPAFNEETGIAHAIDEIKNVLSGCPVDYELIIVDDGSRDNTYQEICNVNLTDHRVKGIKLSRNFGKESAIYAGLEAAKGDAIITIDADLQHPPALIPQMITSWQQGAEIIHAVKLDRSTDSRVARLRASIFNNTLKFLGGIDITNSSDFKLLDRVVVDILTTQLNEKGRFYRGLTNWVGFKQLSLPFTVEERNAGIGKWSLYSLVGLAITAIVSFTSLPLRIITILGLITFVFGAIVATEALASWYQGEAISGFTTTIISILIIGSFIMISLGIIGEYLAKIYDEVKNRPIYIIGARIGINDEAKP